MFSSSKKDLPMLQVIIIDSKDLFDARTYWKKYNRFAAYCLLEFQGSKMRTHDAIATSASPAIPPWNETFNFKVDTKKISPTSIPILTIELWQGKMKEYWQSNKDVKICSIQVPLNNLMDDKPYENVIQLPRGVLHFSMMRSNINQVLPPPIAPSHPQQVSQPPPTGQKLPPPLYVYNPQQYPTAPNTVPTAPSYGPTAPYPTVPPAYANSAPQMPPNMSPAYAPTAPGVPPSYSTVMTSENFPNLYTLQQNMPTAPPVAKPPVLPPKIALPDHVTVNTVIAVYERATQQVTETILGNYFKFCGGILHLFKADDAPVAIIYFSKVQEADTALLLDNGNVCGGPIQVFKYKDYPFRVHESLRGPLERAAKRLFDVTQKESVQVEPVVAPVEEVLYPSLEPANTMNVFVKNISSKVTTDMLADFFSYCGTVTKISVFKGPNDTQVAIVYFEKKESSTTALLLSGAMIQDRVIEVEILAPEKEKELSQVPAISTSHKTNEKMSAESSKSSVVASLLAAGYNVGNSVMTKAKYYDEKHFQLVQALDKAKAKIIDIDNKYEISKKVEKSYEIGRDAFKSALGYVGFNKKQPSSPQTPQQQQQQYM